MTVFEVLAVVGGITGPSAATAEIWSVQRDRPRLRLNFRATTSASDPPSVWLGLHNDGRQPITIREAGFYGSEMSVMIDSREHGELRGTAIYTLNMLTEPVLLDPGHYREFRTGIPNSADYGYPVDFPLRAYAIDARGRRMWGTAAPIVRMLMGEGDCPPGFPARLWEKPEEPLRPARVEPTWKLWVRPELRRGDRLGPFANAVAKVTDAKA